MHPLLVILRYLKYFFLKFKVNAVKKNFRSCVDNTPSKYVKEYIEKILLPVFTQLSSFSNHVQQSVGRLAVKVTSFVKIKTNKI